MRHKKSICTCADLSLSFLSLSLPLSLPVSAGFHLYSNVALVASIVLLCCLWPFVVVLTAEVMHNKEVRRKSFSLPGGALLLSHI